MVSGGKRAVGEIEMIGGDKGQLRPMSIGALSFYLLLLLLNAPHKSITMSYHLWLTIAVDICIDND